ncbi:MAG: deoxyribonuclease [Thermomicrobiales bacterium]|jgi:deoxyribonuclease-4|nr:deoxyribonuclease [Thermomicrobiales bacterium]
MLEIGAHLSVAGGCDLALVRAAELALTSCQIFTKNANQWNAKPLDPAVVSRFGEQRDRTGIRHLVAHDSYLINVASPDEAMWEKSRLALREELERCDTLDVPYLVSHPGGHLGSGEEPGIQRVAEAINRIHDERPDGRAMLLLETTAGQGTTLGRSFEELAAIIQGVEDKHRVGVCFDTCHVFAAGYEIRDRESYEVTMRRFDEVVGFAYLRVFHLNDSRKGLGSRVDRHAHIGEGELGTAPFRFLLSDPRFDGIPGVLETPHGDDFVELKGDLVTLRALAENALVDVDTPSTDRAQMTASAA